MNSSGDHLNTTYSISTADIPQTSTLRLHTKMEQPPLGDQMNILSDKMNISGAQVNTIRLQTNQPQPSVKIISTKLAVGEARTAFNGDQVSSCSKITSSIILYTFGYKSG